MIIHRPRRRRLARDAARVGATLAACMLTLSVWATTDGGAAPAAAAERAGDLTVVVPKGLPGSDQPLSAGGSATPFALVLPEAAACTGDSASGGYRVQSYIVPGSVDPATLTFDAAGPAPAGTGASLRQPLFDTSGNPYVSKQTDIAQPGGTGGGNISGIPSFDFAVFGAEGPTVIPPGTYNVGIACTKGTASPTQLDRFWNVQLAFVADPADKPSGITFTVDQTAKTATTTVLAAAPATGVKKGEEVTLTATVSPANAPGSVTFEDGGVAIGDPVLVAGGSATLKTEDLIVGDHTLSATFTPTGTTFAPSTSATLALAVADATTTTTTTPRSGSTTTVPGSTTTTVASGATTTTTSTTVPGAVGGAAGGLGGSESGSGGFATGGTPSGTSVVGSLATLPVTGGSLSVGVWGALLVILGRMAVLLGRTPAVFPARVG